MTPEQTDAILTALRQRMSEEDDDAIFDALREASKAIRKWQEEDAQGLIPFATELRQWGLLDEAADAAEPPESVDDTIEQDDSPAALVDEVALAKIEPVTPDTNAPDEETESSLQKAYDEALALLQGGRYHAARDVFARLRFQGSDPSLQAAVERYHEEAERKLDRQLQPRIEKARSHAQKQPNDLKGQRKLWNDVLEAAPDDETARQALSRLDEQEQGQKITAEVEQLRERATNALNTLRLPELSRTLGRVESLQQTNTLSHLQPTLDELVQQISRQRAELRGQLGSASTLLVSGNQREAYRQLTEYMDKGLEKVFDQAGILGEAGAEVDTYLLQKEARKLFIDSLRDWTNQRLALVDSQKQQSPQQAQKLLQEVQQKLTDNILSKQDRDELASNANMVQEALNDVEERLARYEQARAKVLAADMAGQSPEARYALFREAQELYPDYPAIAQYVESAQDNLAAIAASQLQDRLTSARRHKELDEFATALTLLQTARREALTQIPQPKPESPLQMRLDEVVNLEAEITAAERDYTHMMVTLADVDDLLGEYEQNKMAGALANARARLEQMSERERQHPQTQKRRSRLYELQGVGDSWEQGIAHYHLAQWADAIQLLNRVANSDAREKDEAARLLKRATAAQYTVEARQAETGQDWEKALTSYRAANGLFQEAGGSDEYTERFYEGAQKALQRLKSLEAADNEVRVALEQAQGWLAQAEMLTQRRVSPLELVEPVAEYDRAATTLLSVRDRPSTLKKKVEEALSQARSAWQSRYRQGMEAAKQSDDLGLLRKAVALGQSLHDHGLLYQSDDKQLWQSLQERFLDAELPQLRRNPATPPQEIEENRRKRLHLASPPTAKLEQEYRQAVEQRVRFELGQQRENGVTAAIAYLKEELVKPELYDNLELFEEWMHLLWETADWPEAQMRAEGLRYRPKLLRGRLFSEMWQGFTIAAQLLSVSDLEQFHAEMGKLQEITQPDPALQLLWERQKEWLVEKRVESLVRLAQAQPVSEEGTIIAAQAYAEAHRLRASDKRVEAGLRTIGKRLEPILQARCQEALNLVTRQALKQTINEADRLYVFLADIHTIARFLGLDREMIQTLDEAVEHLEKKRKPWKQLQLQLESLDRDKSKALTDPLPFRGDQEGGWQFEALQKKLNEVQAAADSSEAETMRLLRQKREELMQLSSRADELNNEVRLLRQALEEETFEEVLTAVANLEKVWPMRAIDGFSGLELLVRYNDPFTQKEYRRLDEHKKRAQTQLNNLKQWQEWAEEVKKAYDKTRQKATLLKQDLDDLRQQKSLAHLEKEFNEILKLCETFAEVFDNRPEVEPLSQRAMDARLRAPTSWFDELLHERSGYQSKAGERLKEIEQEKGRLQQPLKNLRGAMRQLERVVMPTKRFGLTQAPDEQVVGQWIRQAQERLRECRAVDPMHEDVQKQRTRLSELEEKFGGEK